MLPTLLLPHTGIQSADQRGHFVPCYGSRGGSSWHDLLGLIIITNTTSHHSASRKKLFTSTPQYWLKHIFITDTRLTHQAVMVTGTRLHARTDCTLSVHVPPISHCPAGHPLCHVKLCAWLQATQAAVAEKNPPSPCARERTHARTHTRTHARTHTHTPPRDQPAMFRQNESRTNLIHVQRARTRMITILLMFHTEHKLQAPFSGPQIINLLLSELCQESN